MRTIARRAPGRTGVMALCGALAGLALAALPALAQAEPAPGNSVTIDPVGQILPNGNVRLSGTYRCAPEGSGDAVFVSATLGQHGEGAGIGGTKAVCDGATHQWVNVDTQQEVDFTRGPAYVESTLMRLTTTRGLPLPEILDANQREVTLTAP